METFNPAPNAEGLSDSDIQLEGDTSAGNGSPGHVLDLIRRAGGMSRADIITKTGLSRSTVAARLDTLHAAGWISSGQTTSARGRPPSHFHIRAEAGALLVADAGATGVRTAVTDLRGHIRHELRIPLNITIGPEQWLAEVGSLFGELLENVGITADFVRGIGIAVPGPVDFASATVVSPPIMTGWDGYPIRTWFSDRFACPVLVDNDANAMTLGEHATNFADRDSLVMVKVATGVGAGIIAHGLIYRGADGSAGDIGHIQISPPDNTPADESAARVPLREHGLHRGLRRRVGATARSACRRSRRVHHLRYHPPARGRRPVGGQPGPAGRSVHRRRAVRRCEPAQPVGRHRGW